MEMVKSTASTSFNRFHLWVYRTNRKHRKWTRPILISIERTAGQQHSTSSTTTKALWEAKERQNRDCDSGEETRVPTHPSRQPAPSQEIQNAPKPPLITTRAPHHYRRTKRTPFKDSAAARRPTRNLDFYYCRDALEARSTKQPFF